MEGWFADVLTLHGKSGPQPDAEAWKLFTLIRQIPTAASCLALAPSFLRPKVSPAGSRWSHGIPYLLARQLFKIQQQMASVLVPFTSDSLRDRSRVGPSWAARPTASNLGSVLISSSWTSHRSVRVKRSQATGTLRAEIILSAGPDALGLTSLSSSAGHIHSARTSEPMPHTYNCGHCQRHKLKKNSFLIV